MTQHQAYHSSSLDATIRNTSPVTVAQALIHSLLHLIERDRDGEIVDRALLRDTVRMLSELHVYHELFIPPLLETSSIYYAREGVRVMEMGSTGDGGSDVSGFLRHVERRLDQCQEACVEYLEGLDNGVVISASINVANSTSFNSTASVATKVESGSRYHG